MQDRVLAGQPCKFREMRRDPAPAGRLVDRRFEGQKKQYRRAATTQE
jgi:hypothetical protein